ncbi:MAG: hypothetical protein R3E64_04000 [Halioglobus sp.]
MVEPRDNIDGIWRDDIGDAGATVSFHSGRGRNAAWTQDIRTTIERAGLIGWRPEFDLQLTVLRMIDVIVDVWTSGVTLISTLWRGYGPDQTPPQAQDNF